MESESEIILSFLFKRSGREKLKFSDLYLALSMDLNWFTPDDAKTFINLALKQNLLTKEGIFIKPNFDFENIVVPIGFTPSERKINLKKVEKQEKEDESILDKIIKRLIEKTNLDKVQITELINLIAKEKNIKEEVAGILIGKKYNTNFEEFYKQIEEKIFNID